MAIIFDPPLLKKQSVAKSLRSVARNVIKARTISNFWRTPLWPRSGGGDIHGSTGLGERCGGTPTFADSAKLKKKTRIRTPLGSIRILPLPPFCPELNPAERFGRVVKAPTVNRLYRTPGAYSWPFQKMS
jgi:hypothetical protein